MDSELIMRSDVLDIVFEKRNKAYGAYRLRKFYKNRLIKSVVAMIAMVAVFSAFTFLPEGKTNTDEFIVTEPEFAHIPPTPKIPEIKPKLNKPAVVTTFYPLKLFSNIIIAASKDSTDVLQTPGNNSPVGNSNILFSGPGSQLVDAAGIGDIGSDPIKLPEPPVDITKPMDNPEIMPSYPGGMEALRRFLIRNLHNPRDLEEGELISVKVKFVVGFDGVLQGFELIQDGGPAFNNEVIRVLKKMPAWIPGKSKGRSVSVYYAIPVKFIPEG